MAILKAFPFQESLSQMFLTVCLQDTEAEYLYTVEGGEENPVAWHMAFFPFLFIMVKRPTVLSFALVY